MTEEQRIEFMTNDYPAFLRDVIAPLIEDKDKEKVLLIAHQIEKFGKLVVDRDAAPNLDNKVSLRIAEERVAKLEALLNG